MERNYHLNAVAILCRNGKVERYEKKTILDSLSIVL